MLLRYGVPFGAFIDITKRVYVNVAMEEFAAPGRKPSISRAAVITGLSRKEILRVRRLPEISDEAALARYNRATRVMGGWLRDQEFAEKQGVPAALPVEGGRGSFADLVRKYSGDVPPRAILDELLRAGAVARDANGKIQMRARGYVPSEGEEDKLAILGTDVAQLIQTIDHNLKAPAEASRLQLKVSYDNLPREALGRFRSGSARDARRLLERFDKGLAVLDRDTNPEAGGTGRMRAGVAIYYFEEDLSAGEDGV
jgi:hypothetical protein